MAFVIPFNKCCIILINDMNYNLIAIKKLFLAHMRDYSYASMLFEIIYNLLIWSHGNRKVACCDRHLHFC